MNAATPTSGADDVPLPQQSQPLNAATLAHARASTAVQPQRPGGETQGQADSDDLALFMRRSRNVSDPTATALLHLQRHAERARASEEQPRRLVLLAGLIGITIKCIVLEFRVPNDHHTHTTGYLTDYELYKMKRFPIGFSYVKSILKLCKFIDKVASILLQILSSNRWLSRSEKTLSSRCSPACSRCRSLSRGSARLSHYYHDVVAFREVAHCHPHHCHHCHDCVWVSPCLCPSAPLALIEVLRSPLPLALPLEVACAFMVGARAAAALPFLDEDEVDCRMVRCRSK